MKIQKAKIHNYRSICELEMICEHLVILLGPNNHGKSNILSAIEFVLTSSAKLTDADFNIFCGDDKEIWVEITFHELTEQEKTTFKKYCRQDGTFCIRKSARLQEDGKIDIGLHGYCQEPDELWLRESQVGSFANRDAITNVPLKDYVPASGRITQDIIRDAQKRYIAEHLSEITYHEALEATLFIGPKNIGGGLLPDFYLIPAVRDLTDETKIKGASAFGKLLSRTIHEMAERDPKFQELRNNVDKLVQTLNRSEGGEDKRPVQLIELEKTIETELKEWGVGVEIEVIPPSFERFFEIGTNLHLDDGVRTLAENKGHGLQRVVIFALFRAWAHSLRNLAGEGSVNVPRISSESIIFAIEEPELFLHPHAQKKMAQAIQEIAKSPNHQVLVCSHSSHFVDLDNYRNICIVSKESPQRGTGVRQCTTELFEGTSSQEKKKRFHAAHWINPDRGEMFFAKRVAFVEGETEKVIFPYLAQKMNCFNQEVSIIDCGSKFNLPLYSLIANAFKIPYIVVYDEDPLPNLIPSDIDPQKLAELRRVFEFNQHINSTIDPSIGNVCILSPHFEGASGVSTSQGEKIGKPLAALDHFSTITSDAIPHCIKEIVRIIYSS